MSNFEFVQMLEQCECSSKLMSLEGGLLFFNRIFKTKFTRRIVSNRLHDIFVYSVYKDNLILPLISTLVLCGVTGYVKKYLVKK